MYKRAHWLTVVCPPRSFTHFLTGVCAIIGGVFTGRWHMTVCTQHFCSNCNLDYSFSLSSCWTHRFFNIPLSKSYTEEDWVGKSFLAISLKLPWTIVWHLYLLKERMFVCVFGHKEHFFDTWPRHWTHTGTSQAWEDFTLMEKRTNWTSQVAGYL